MPDTTTIPQHPTDGPIHTAFGLSYASYLTLPRTLLQSMPIPWQERFVALLDEFHAAFAHVPQAEAYEVTAGTEHVVSEMDERQLALAGVSVDYYGGEEPPSKLAGNALADWEEEHETEPTYQHIRDGREMDQCERVILPGDDPVPHYNRGRTYIEPAAGYLAGPGSAEPPRFLADAFREAAAEFRAEAEAMDVAFMLPRRNQLLDVVRQLEAKAAAPAAKES